METAKDAKGAKVLGAEACGGEGPHVEGMRV